MPRVSAAQHQVSWPPESYKHSWEPQLRTEEECHRFRGTPTGCHYGPRPVAWGSVFVTHPSICPGPGGPPLWCPYFPSTQASAADGLPGERVLGATCRVLTADLPAPSQASSPIGTTPRSVGIHALSTLKLTWYRQEAERGGGVGMGAAHPRGFRTWCVSPWPRDAREGPRQRGAPWPPG